MAAVKSDVNENKIAPRPFNSNTADAILRSSDGVDFHVHQVILALASPFFSTMFTLKQPLQDGTEVGDKLSRKDPIPVTEHSTVLYCLLRFCYPLRHPQIAPDLDLLGRVLEAGMKYDIDCAVHALRQSLSSLSHSASLQVYALCCRLNVEDIAQSAAHYLLGQQYYWLSNNWKPSELANSFEDTLHGHLYIPVFKSISAGAYFRLLRFLRSRRLVSGFPTTPVPAEKVPTFCQPEANPSQQQSLQLWNLEGADADTVLESTDGVHFPVHRLVLKIAGAQALILTDAAVDGTCNSVHVNLPSATLHELLRACYPTGVIVDSRSSSSKTNAKTIPFHVLHAAQRFKITSVLDSAKSQWDDYLSECPLTAYLGAVALGWNAEAERAAKATVDRDIADTYSEEMENVSAEVYQQLISYHYRCRSAASEAARRHLDLSDADWKSMCISSTNEYPLASSQSLLLPTHRSFQHHGWSRDAKSLNTSTMAAIEKAISAISLTETV